MTQQRLNNLMILHAYKDLTDKLNLRDIANTFIGDSEHRLKVFGKIKWELEILPCNSLL